MDDIFRAQELLNENKDTDLTPEEVDEFGKTHGYIPKSQVDSFFTGAQAIIDNAMKGAKGAVAEPVTKNNVAQKMQDYMKPVYEVDDDLRNAEANANVERERITPDKLGEKLAEALSPKDESEVVSSE